jgi:hypothetical protein
MIMVRLLIILALAVLVLLGGSAIAIDKKKVKGKNVPVSQTEDKVENKDTGTALPETKRKVKDPVQGQYDDFVDKNGNGIDDRAEKSQQKPEKSKERDKKTPIESDKAKSDGTPKTKKTKN